MLSDYPDLANDTVRLRSWNMDDLPFVETAARQVELTEGFTVPLPYSRAEGIAFIERQLSRLTENDGVSFAIADADTDEAKGLLYMGQRQQPRTVGLGYGLLREARGQGLTTSAVHLLSRWALNTGVAERVEAMVEPWNKPSRQILVRNGFQLEGLLRSYQVFLTRRADVLMFSLLPGDLENDVRNEPGVSRRGVPSDRPGGPSRRP